MLPPAVTASLPTCRTVAQQAALALQQHQQQAQQQAAVARPAPVELQLTSPAQHPCPTPGHLEVRCRCCMHTCTPLLSSQWRCCHTGGQQTASHGVARMVGTDA